MTEDNVTPDEQAPEEDGGEVQAPTRRYHGVTAQSGLSAPYGLMAKRAARRRGLEWEEPEFIETIPGTEGEAPVNIEGVPLAEGETGTPAVVIDADGNEVPAGDDGIPVLTDESGTPAAETPGDATEAEPTTEDPTEPENGEETGTQGEAEAEPADEAPADEGYDPGAHTVAEVQAYLEENPDQSGYVLDRERAGKARVTLLGD